MARTKKTSFPKILHVVREQGDGTTWLSVREGGVLDIDEPMPIAIYQLVEVGSVAVERRFVPAKRTLPKAPR